MSPFGRKGEMIGKAPGDEAAGLLASLVPHLPAYGITRVGLLTGLDVLGIPVAFAARPNSRSLSVTQGKSLYADEAQLGAVMEAFEQAFAERSEALTVCRAEAKELGARAVDLSRLHRAAEPSQSRIAWARATSLISGAERLVPLELVDLDLRAGRRSDFSASPVSGLGLAAGPTWEAAATHALLEVIEHNATAAIDFFGLLDGFARPVRCRAGDHAALDEIISRIAQAGLRHQLYDISAPGGLPVIGAFLDCPDLAPGWIQFAGFACRFSPEHAAEAALLEAVQSRLTVIAGARDDLNAATYRGRGPSQAASPQGEFLCDLPNEYAELRHAQPRQKLAYALDCAEALGARDILAATIGEIPGVISVVRIIATDLEANGLNAPTLFGRRTLEALFAAIGVTR
jgi:ribosomal protein S12 methylthiotransferase accessory factor